MLEIACFFAWIMDDFAHIDGIHTIEDIHRNSNVILWKYRLKEFDSNNETQHWVPHQTGKGGSLCLLQETGVSVIG